MKNNLVFRKPLNIFVKLLTGLKPVFRGALMKTKKMKKSIIGMVVLLLLTFNFLTLRTSFSQNNVGINTTGAVPNSSSILDLNTGNTFTSPNGKGLLIPNVALASTTDVATITTPANALMVYNTNAAMTNGNGAGFYYYSTSAAKWIYVDAASNGPGTAGQVLTSQGSGSQPTYTAITSGGGGSTGCASCITQTAVGTLGTWSVCAQSCVAMGAGWRMPTWDEEVNIGSGALGTPTGGWIGGNVWTSTPWDARVAGTPSDGNWVVFFESNGFWTFTTYTNSIYCRCVR